METPCHDRLTILPPPPSLSRTLHALAVALWFGVATRFHRGFFGLVRAWQRWLTSGWALGSRWTPVPESPAEPAESPEPAVHLSALLARLRRDPPLCHAAASSHVGAPALRRTAPTAQAVTRVG